MLTWRMWSWKILDDSSLDNTNETKESEEDLDVAIDDPVPNSSHSVVQSSEQFSFEFIAFDQDIHITGAKASGKSYLANVLMKSFNGISVWVYDFNAQFSSSRAMVFHDLDELIEVYDSAKRLGTGRGHYILQPFENSENTFRKFNAEAFKRGNLILIEDEIHSFCSKQSNIKEFNNNILSGRPRGLSMVTISSRPASCPNNVLSNARHVFAFKLNLESDLKFLESYLGHDVWILLPKDKRKRLKEEPELEPHTFYYRDMDRDTGVISKV